MNWSSLAIFGMVTVMEFCLDGFPAGMYCIVSFAAGMSLFEPDGQEASQ